MGTSAVATQQTAVIETSAPPDNGMMFQIEDKLSPGQGLFFGIQQVLAMDVYVAPLILAGLLALNVRTTAYFIEVTFLACGVATIIQSGFGMKMPFVQGPTWVPVGAMAAITRSFGLPVCYGALIPGAIVYMALGWPLRVFSKIVKNALPPIVGGTVIIVIGMAMMGVGWKMVLFAPGNMNKNFLETGCTAIVLIVGVVLGGRKGRSSHFFRIASVLYAIVVGFAIAYLCGNVDFTPVVRAHWLSIPTVFPYGAPVFRLMPTLTMFLIYFIVMIETIGGWFAMEAITASKLTEPRLNKGTLGEGLGCLISVLVGGIPVTAYGTNAGVVQVTRVASRWATVYAGIILIILGLITKLMYVLAIIPPPVITGVFFVLTITIVMAGFRVVQQYEVNDRNTLVVGLPIFVTIGCAVMPQEMVFRMPAVLSILIASAIAPGALLAPIVHWLLPDKHKTHPMAGRAISGLHDEPATSA